MWVIPGGNIGSYTTRNGRNTELFGNDTWVGAMLGKLIAESGAADKITHKLVTKFGRKHIQSSLILVGFIIGIPLFYTVGFVILVPFDVNSITDLQKIPEILGNRGYSENDIKNICGNNWIQFLRNAWDK